LPRLYDAEPALIACDLHPDYLSTQYALSRSAHVHRVQHHWAHVLACMAENQVTAPALGIAWDGMGLGTDGTIWGGEFLLAREDGFERVAHLRPFRLPGGDTAMKEPRRSALGLLYEIFEGDLFEKVDLPPMRSFSAKERNVLKQMLERGVNAPVTTSGGRLFDAVASLLDLHQITTFEGQAAMSLEFAIKHAGSTHYPFELSGNFPCVINWEPMIVSILEEKLSGTAIDAIAARFHETLSAIMIAIAERIGERKVVLTGGCFQNKHLTELSVQRLQAAGFEPYWHRRVPPNDGGIALGQIISAARSLNAS
jgi:hydrogenase maturation protein HypF